MRTCFEMFRLVGVCEDLIQGLQEAGGGEAGFVNH